MSNTKQQILIRKMKGNLEFGIIHLKFRDLKIIKDSINFYASTNKHPAAQKISAEISQQIDKITV